jgi:hypothetical protein
LDTIETQPTYFPEVEMAGRPGRGNQQPPTEKRMLRPIEVKENWDEEIEKEGRERARQESKKAAVEGGIRPEADSRD